MWYRCEYLSYKRKRKILIHDRKLQHLNRKKTQFMSYFAKDETMKLRLEYGTWHLLTVHCPRAVRKVFQQGIVPSQKRNYAGILSGNLYSARCKELFPLSVGNMSLR
jgi:hypothetical protein